MSLLFFRVVRAIFEIFCKLYWRFSVEGANKLPTEGSYLLAPIHRSYVDTPLVASIMKRRHRYMGKSTFFKPSWLGNVFRSLGAFPVRRETADREAIRKCLQFIEAGESIVVFPEGTRRVGSRVEDLHEGVAYLALRTGVPIYPIGISGSERALPRGAKLFRPVKVHAVVGDPIEPNEKAAERPPRRVITELTERLTMELQSLLDQADEVAKTYKR